MATPQLSGLGSGDGPVSNQIQEEFFNMMPFDSLTGFEMNVFQIGMEMAFHIGQHHHQHIQITAWTSKDWCRGLGDGDGDGIVDERASARGWRQSIIVRGNGIVLVPAHNILHHVPENDYELRWGW